MRKVNSFRRLVGAGVIAGSIAASLVTTAPSGAAVSAHGDQVPKTALISPMGPTDHANMIFPYASGAYFTVTNMNDFQSYLYRPLYWVGKGSDITIQKDLSLAALPVYSNGNKTITITMKGWKFSNGETIDAQSVKFFLDLYAAVPFRYAGYVPGFGIPDQVSNVTASGNVLTITTSVAVNPNWFNYNFLTEITPFPRAWDKKYDTPSSDTIANTPSIATSAANCGTADYTNIVDLAAKCGYYPNGTADVYGVPHHNSAAVYNGAYGYLYYNSRPSGTGNLAAYDSSPIWSVVDGPWKLSSFSATGDIVYVPNNQYSGLPKPKFATYTQKAEASIATEKLQLEAGQLDTGYVNPTDVSISPKPGVAGHNLISQLSGYTVRTGGSWAFYYAYYNFNAASSGTHLVQSLAVRQAFQYGIDQLTIIKALYNGYGVPGYGPIPTLPANVFSKGLVNHYAFSTTKGIAALKAAGFTWDKNTSHAAVCTKAGGCGNGITQGTALNLTYKYTTGSPTLDAQMNAEKASWAKEGIQVTLSTDTPDNIASLCTAGAGSAPTTGNPDGNGDWQICQYGGWLYAPDYYPSGELLFYTDALSNPGEYSNTTMDALIDATTKGTTALNAGKNSYAQYAMDQLPYMYQPTGTGTGEMSKTLKGVLPPNPTGASLPEFLSK